MWAATVCCSAFQFDPHAPAEPSAVVIPSHQCTSEDEARYVANGIRQDELNTGAIECPANKA